MRVARSGAGVGVDVRRRIGGRGAWLHRDPRCWSTARGGLARTLRTSVTDRDLAAVRAALTALNDLTPAKPGDASSDSGLLRRDAVDIATRSQAQE